MSFLRINTRNEHKILEVPSLNSQRIYKGGYKEVLQEYRQNKTPTNSNDDIWHSMIEPSVKFMDCIAENTDLEEEQKTNLIDIILSIDYAHMHLGMSAGIKRESEQMLLIRDFKKEYNDYYLKFLEKRHPLLVKQFDNLNSKPGFSLQRIQINNLIHMEHLSPLIDEYLPSKKKEFDENKEFIRKLAYQELEENESGLSFQSSDLITWLVSIYSKIKKSRNIQEEEKVQATYKKINEILSEARLGKENENLEIILTDSIVGPSMRGEEPGMYAYQQRILFIQEDLPEQEKVLLHESIHSRQEFIDQEKTIFKEYQENLETDYDRSVHPSGIEELEGMTEYATQLLHYKQFEWNNMSYRPEVTLVRNIATLAGLSQEEVIQGTQQASLKKIIENKYNIKIDENEYRAFWDKELDYLTSEEFTLTENHDCQFQMTDDEVIIFMKNASKRESKIKKFFAKHNVSTSRAY